MRYTRYDLKKDKNSKTFVILISSILLSAFILGTFIFQVMLKDPGNLNYEGTSQSTSTLKKGDIKFIAVQGGIYRDKNNAEKEKELLSKYGLPFYIAEPDKTRVFLGIFLQNDADKIMKSLNGQNVETSKMVFTVKQEDVCNTEIVQIIDANLKILNKLSSKDVESIQTSELKKWCSSLEKDRAAGGKNKLVLDELNEYINKLPGEITKDNSEENYVYLFNVLKKIGSN
ncbi:MAG TPA: hypothetical protein DC034_05255 [Clostridium sp.]|uniref:SPOR domain-containing protein n=1 Tax=Clostridium lapidicellarium TaxID=3240931 RepID=A0ABV4DUW9_9CLOT|nr:hypothetical protein [uncultured Clostridium sp.]HBC96190.1 hypothetical protein [Clostridium sp.]